MGWYQRKFQGRCPKCGRDHVTVAGGGACTCGGLVPAGTEIPFRHENGGKGFEDVPFTALSPRPPPRKS